jgi:two-component system response regulator AdeR
VTGRTPLVLIAEDERELADIFRRYFERDGFSVVTVGDGASAVEGHRRLKPDLVVLDVRLPRLDGFEALAQIRGDGMTPIIMSTALGEDLEKLTALRIGADDYLVKPFNPLELVARAKAVLRRSQAIDQAERSLRVGFIEIDPVAHEVWVKRPEAPAVLLQVTRTEFRILEHMAGAPRKAFTRSEIIDSCLPGDNEALDRTVDSHISNLRAKFASAGLDAVFQVVRGVGYRLTPS